MKQRLQKLLLRLMFTPVRAIKLQRASIRPEGEVTAVLSQLGSGSGLSFSVHYGHDCESFRYDRNERDLFEQERKLIEGMISTERK